MENKTVFLVLGVRAGKRSRFGVQIPEPYEIKQPFTVIRFCFSACFPRRHLIFYWLKNI